MTPLSGPSGSRESASVPRVGALLLLLLSLSLGGCFESPAPLITASESDHPLKPSSGQQYGWENGSWQPRGAVTLDLDGPYYVLKGREPGDVSRFLLKQLDDNSYVAQSEETSSSGRVSYIYALVVIDGERISVNSFLDESSGCNVPGVSASSGTLHPSDGGCVLPSLAALVEIFRVLRQSSAKPETLYIITP